MYRYEVVRMDRSSRKLFGILGREKLDGDWIPVVVAAPFSSNCEAVSMLAEKCTTCQLSPEHLIDVISDFISQTASGT